MRKIRCVVYFRQGDIWNCRELCGLSEYIIIFSKILIYSNDFLKILCATIWLGGYDRYKN